MNDLMITWIFRDISNSSDIFNFIEREIGKCDDAWINERDEPCFHFETGEIDIIRITKELNMQIFYSRIHPKFMLPIILKVDKHIYNICFMLAKKSN